MQASNSELMLKAIWGEASLEHPKSFKVSLLKALQNQRILVLKR